MVETCFIGHFCTFLERVFGLFCFNYRKSVWFGFFLTIERVFVFLLTIFSYFNHE